MEERNPAHRGRDEKRWVDGSGALQRKPLLLPYEWELCKQLGITEEEYRWFKAELAERAYVRPAEYDHIPDIRCDPVLTPILINLAIGLALTAVSYLLAPKPTEPEERKDRQIRKSNINGRDRFAATYGFDSVAEIAQLGEPVPIVWTRYTGTTGGVVVEPKLIWSRVYSYGHTQVAKALYVASEGAIGKPARAGLWLGNNGVDVLSYEEYAFFYGHNVSDPPLVEGSKGDDTSGDPTPGYFPNFVQSWSPSNNATFGGSHPIANGTNYRVNWRVVSIPDDGTKNSKVQARLERKKICGYGLTRHGMKGVGTGYPRRLGFTSLYSFLITGKQLNKNLFKVEVTDDGDRTVLRASVDDINKALDQECIAADDLLQIGERFMCGNKQLQVTSRSREIWVPGDENDQVIGFRELGTIYSGTASQPQPVSINAIKNTKYVAIDSESRNQGGQGGGLIGGGNTPLLRYTEARVKNTRPVDSTEICIRSIVWARANGICNFNDIPYPRDLKRYDNDNVSIQSGSMSTYFQRTVGFKIKMRPVGSEGAWSDTSPVFLVRGATPQAQYNYLRMFHSRGMFEYRLIPLNGAILLDMAQAGVSGIWLNASVKDFHGFSLAHGVTGSCKGRAISLNDCIQEPLFWQDESDRDTSAAVIPLTLTKAQVVGARKVTIGKVQAIYADIFGDASLYQQGQTRQQVISTDAKIRGKRTKLDLSVLVQARAGTLNVNGIRPAWLDFQYWVWDINKRLWTGYSESEADGITDPGDTYVRDADRRTDRSERWRNVRQTVYEVNITSANPYHVSNLGVDGADDDDYTASLRFTIGSSGVPSGDQFDRPERRFIHNAQVHDVSHYGNLIETSCDNGPEHAVTSVNEIINHTRPSGNDLTLAGIAVRAGRSFNTLDQLRMYIKSGVNNSNSFPALVSYLLGKVATASGSRRLDPSLIDTASITAAQSFCDSNRLFYDGVLSQRTNLRTFIAQTAPFFLLSMVVSNGKIGLKEAIPRTGAVQLFTAGNIVDGSLNVEMIDISQRRDFQAVMIYRQNLDNQLPESRTVRLAYDTNAPMEQFDMSQFCTSRDHAIKVGRFFLALRRYITKQVSFQTTPDQVRFGPGDLISVALDTGVVRAMETGTVLADGSVVTPVPMKDGNWPVVYWSPGMVEVHSGTLTLQNGKTTDSEFFGAVFASTYNTVTTDKILVESVNITEDGLVEVQGTDFPDAIATATFSGGGIGIYD